MKSDVLALENWLRTPDYAETFSLLDTAKWISERPLAQFYRVKDELEKACSVGDRTLPDGRNMHAQEMSLIKSQLANCHKEIKRLREALLSATGGAYSA